MAEEKNKKVQGSLIAERKTHDLEDGGATPPSAIIRNIVEIHSFTDEEVSNIQRYVEAHVPHGLLSETFLLSEKPIDKIKVYLIVYRILRSVRDYSRGDTCIKINNLLNESIDIHENINSTAMDYINSEINFGKNRKLRKLTSILKNEESDRKINKLISAFLLFSEKIEVFDLDTITGVDSTTDQGKELVSNIQKIMNLN